MKRKDAPVHAQIKQTQRNVARDAHGHERQSGPTRKNESENSSESREQDGLRQHLADHAPAGSAESGTRGEFFSAAVGAGENEIGNVSAGDEKDKSNEQHKDEGGRGHKTSHQAWLRAGLEFWHDEQRHASVSVREFLSQATIERFGGSHGLRRCDSRLDPAKNAKVGGAAFVEVVLLIGIEKPHGCERNIEVRFEEVIGSTKVFGSDADDSERVVVDLHSLADDCGIAAETLLPEFIAEDQERILAWDPALIRGESAASDSLNTEHRKVIAANHLGPSALGTALGAEIYRARGICDEVGKDCFELAVVLEIGVGNV